MRHLSASRALGALLVCLSQAAWADYAGSAALDAAIEQAIREDQIPGAVVLVGHNGQIVHRKAYGYRAVLPNKELLTPDTIFDMASLTKVVATTPACMKLFEEGKLRLNDRIVRYLPEFEQGKSAITVRNLLTHFSGLRPDIDLKPAWSGYESGMKLALAEKAVTPPGARFVYSDINFILLGEIVHRLSGRMLSDYVREEIFKPLGMKDSMFQPPAELRPRIAPTETVDGVILRGVVHDPTTRAMGGVAGHAGLFSTADDLARYAQFLLDLGESGGRRVLSPLTVRKFSEPQSPPDQPILRGLGFDIDSPYSASRGELYPIGSYGHTGFTGTSIWIDPYSKSYVILLTSALHPHDRPAVSPLRARVATIVAASFGIDLPQVALTGYTETFTAAGVHRAIARNAQVLTGLDVLEAENFASLRGKRVGLITNQSGLDKTGQRNVDRMLAAGVAVKALFSPEHGISGSEDHENIANSKDAATGLPVWSLYSGPNRRPSEAALKDLDALVFDIQDAGARFYTYSTTMAYSMEEAARRHLPFYVLDRPNPITGTHVEGPLLEPGLRSFVGYAAIPVRHGMTFGELARFFNAEAHIGADLHVVSMKGWQRGDWFDSTGLSWVDPSPNLRSLNAELLYPGLAMLEYCTNYSVGRGTPSPFEQVGAEFIKGTELAAYLNEQWIPGVRVYPVRFTPAGGKPMEGVRFVVTDREALDSVRLGLEVAVALQHLYPGKLDLMRNDKLIGDRGVIAAIQKGSDADEILHDLQDGLKKFVAQREPYLLYK